MSTESNEVSLQLEQANDNEKESPPTSLESSVASPTENTQVTGQRVHHPQSRTVQGNERSPQSLTMLLLIYWNRLSPYKAKVTRK